MYDIELLIETPIYIPYDIRQANHVEDYYISYLDILFQFTCA